MDIDFTPAALEADAGAEADADDAAGGGGADGVHRGMLFRFVCLTTCVFDHICVFDHLCV